MDDKNDKQEGAHTPPVVTREVTDDYHLLVANLCVEMSKFLPQVYSSLSHARIELLCITGLLS